MGFEISGHARNTPSRLAGPILLKQTLRSRLLLHVVPFPNHLKTPYNGCTRAARFGVSACPRCAACGAAGRCAPPSPPIGRRAIARVGNCTWPAGRVWACARSGSLSPPDGHGSRGRARKGRRTGRYRQLPIRNALLAAQYGATGCPVRRYLRLRCPRMSPAASIAAAAKNALLSDEADGEGHRGGEGPSTSPSMERKVPSGARRTGRSSRTIPPVGGMPP